MRLDDAVVRTRSWIAELTPAMSRCSRRPTFSKWKRVAALGDREADLGDHLVRGHVQDLVAPEKIPEEDPSFPASLAREPPLAFKARNITDRSPAGEALTMLPATVARFRMGSEAIRAKCRPRSGSMPPDDGRRLDLGQGRRRPDAALAALDADPLEILAPREEGQIRVAELVGLRHEEVRAARDQDGRTMSGRLSPGALALDSSSARLWSRAGISRK